MTPAKVTREEVRHRYEQRILDDDLDGVYRNYGDANPAGHGGIWIAYNVERGTWDVWITHHAAEVGLADPDDERPGHQYVEAAEIDFRDVVAEDGSWSNTFDHIPETYHRGHDQPVGAVVDGDLTAFVAHEAREWSDPYPYRDPGVFEESYEAVLDRFGIEPRDE